MAAYFELDEPAAGRFVFALKSTDGAVLLTSVTHRSRMAARLEIEATRGSAQRVSRFIRVIENDSTYHFAIVSEIGHRLATSAVFASRAALEGAIGYVMAVVATAPVRERGSIAGAKDGSASGQVAGDRPVTSQ
ncbi:MAG TPA: hypothetical protein VLA28_06570 [Afifellaceae bacterium]|nr:hypothetical protein [Afifellaceae bacterium]